MNHINVLYASDDNYAPIAGVSITSLFENNQDADQIHVWYLADNVSQDNIVKLLRTADKYNRIISFLDVGQSLKKVEELGARAWFNGSFSTYSRLFFQDYIEEGIDRLLYLDCDTVVNQNISELWEYDLESKTVGMICDYINAEIRDVIGLERTDKYYNGGVQLINVHLWKANKCQERILWHMKNKNASYPYVDQDIVNIVLKDEIKTLPWNWNVYPYYYTYSFKNIQKQYGLNEVNQYSIEEYKRGLTADGKPNAMILHYTATFYGKPWYSNNCNPTKEVWNKYYKMSEWNGSYKILPAKLGFFNVIQRIIAAVIPQKIYLYIFRYFSRKNIKGLKKSLK